MKVMSKRWLALFFPALLLLLPLSVFAQLPGDLITELHSEAPTYSATFTRDDGSWSTESDDDVARFYERRMYHLQATAKAGVVLSAAPIEVADALLEVSALHVAGPPDSAAGLFFRAVDAENFYLFTIVDGQYALVRFDDGKPTLLAPPTRSKVIERGDGAYNRLGVIMLGTSYLLFANDTLLVQVEDDRFEHGGAGIALVAAAGEPLSEYAFDDLEIWDLAEHPDIVLSTPTTTETNTISMMTIEDIRANEPVYGARFTRNDGSWLTGGDDDVERLIERRAYHLVVHATNAVGVSLAGQNFADFYLEASAWGNEAPESAGGGIIFRAQDDKNYYFYTVMDGRFALGLMVDGEETMLVESTAANVLERGADAFNRLGIYAQGANFTLIANDAIVASTSDDTYTEGDVGVMVQTMLDVPAEFSFDDIEVWALAADRETREARPQPAATPTARSPHAATPTPGILTPKPTATPTAIPRAYTPDDFTIEWGAVEHLFTVSNVRIEQQWMTTQLGQAVETTVLAFDVRANTSIAFGVFLAHFYDAEGNEVGLFSPVIFDPLPDLGWEQGMRGKAVIILPEEDLADIVHIEIKQFM